MSSPIRSVVRNLSDRKIRYDFGKQRSLTVTPKGTAYDVASIEGDVFSLFRDSREAEALIQGIIRGVVEVSYVIESPYKVGVVDKRQMSMIGALAPKYEKWLKESKASTEAKEEDPVEEERKEEAPAAEEPKEEAPVVENPAPVEESKEEEAPAVEEAPVIEEVPTEESPVVEEVPVEESPVVAESTVGEAPAVEPVQEPEPEVGKKRSSRKLKAQ